MKKSLMNPVFLRNKTNVIAVAALLSISNLSAQTFSDFNYRGNDKIYNDNPLKPDEFYSPILQGCYPDPSITKKGEDYYLVNSSFSMFPGVPIFTSKDLVNWKQVGHVLDRPSQLKVEKSGVSHGIYAPDIKYNKHNDTFYMITTQFAGGIGNMVVKTKDPAKGWSEVQKLNFEGIDPSIFFDDDGKAYIVHNDAPPQGTEQYNGHRVIKIWDYDLEKDQVVAGSDKIIVNGGVDLSQKPIWIEGPHIYKRNGKYYLMCAEGGTGGNHSEVIFMADSPKGPFVPAKNNPILTQRYFPRDRKEKVDWAGHADLVEGPNGQWYGVFLAIRPNVSNRVNKGRETFILPVDCSGTYPVFQNGLVPMKPKLKMPQGAQNQTGKNGFFPNGNFTYNDKLTDKNLDFRWIAMRGPRENFITATKSGVKVNPMETNIKALAPISSLFHRLQHESFETSVTLDYKPKSEKELAGITLYQSETFNYVFGITKKDKDFYIVLERTEKGQSKLIASEKISLSKPVKLQVVADKDEYSFNYSLDGRNYKNLGGPVSGDILSTDVAGGFTGSLIGLYSTSSNDIVPN
ncbi:glycoside hydrolase family 43 protein [Chryseobacterium rhizoplanae]|uniref:glycoside hydrolase family 43 protein n=1 Tax=Chryseobacterium rhizoplanae TaxID=1609531 RepID=UPI001CE27547|nr:glycoside hydrolase family 43 protein [Chryseobacterium rhizoplanae]UCA60068.1 glycoside hydrolase family 43 protein [Chryseobacterium rhizoplanae]